MFAELFVLIIEPVPSLFFCFRPVSVAMDARLEMGLDTNVEIVLRRLTTRSAFNLITSLPHVAMMPELLGIGASAGQPSDSLPPWPDTITDVWSGPEYLQGMETNVMLTEVFDNILSDLHQLDSWLNLEKILQLWLTLNGETLENIPGSCSTGLNPYSFPRIPFGDRAVKGLLKALASHPNIKLRAWCLGFHCLILACKPHFEADCEDVHCRYCLASSKLMDLLVPYFNSDASNIAHMQAFLNRMKDTSFGGALGSDGYGTYINTTMPAGSSVPAECAKVTAAYEECIGFQHQLNVIRRVIDRIRPSVDLKHPTLAQLMLPTQPTPLKPGDDLSSIYTDKLRIMSECLIEVVLQLVTTYGSMPGLAMIEQQQQQQQVQHISQDMCNLLFDTMVIAGDAHTQLATCSMLVRMCCLESWWGDFLADKFLTLYSSQNDRIFPQDR